MAKKRRRKKPRKGRSKARRAASGSASTATEELGTDEAETSGADEPEPETDTDDPDEPEPETTDEPEHSEPETTDEPEEVRKPHAGAAALLSLLVPGAGQVYAGRRTRGVLWWAIPSAVVLFCTALAPQLGPWPMLIALLGSGIVPRILAPADAYLMAKRPDAAAPAGLIVILGLMGLFAGNRAVANLIDRYFFASFGVLTHAMTPTLLPGDQVFVDRRAFDSSPSPGDAVLVGDAEQARVLRVIAEKGDTIEWRQGHLAINDAPLERCSAGTIQIGEEDHPVYVHWLGERAFLMVDDGQSRAPVTVESDLALLGDGLMVPAVSSAAPPELPRFEQRPASEVQGRPWTIFWSTAPPGDDGSGRNDRVGLRLDGDAPITAGLPPTLAAGVRACLQR